MVYLSIDYNMPLACYSFWRSIAHEKTEKSTKNPWVIDLRALKRQVSPMIHSKSAPSRLIKNLWVVLPLVIFAQVSCLENQSGTPIPNDSFHYPVGATLLNEDSFMAVTSSNFDLRYTSGQLHVIDLLKVNEALTDSGPWIPLSDVSLATMNITSFGSRPVILSDEDKVMGWVHRDQTGAFGAQITETSQNATLQCLGEINETCDAMEPLDTMSAHPARPFADERHMWVPHLSESKLTRFAKGSTPTQWKHETTLDLSDSLSSIRMGAMSQDVNGEKRLWLAGQYMNDTSLSSEAKLIWFLNPVEDTTLSIQGKHNITQATGSTTINDLAWAQNESMMALALQNPDGIAVFNVTQNTYQTPQITLKHLKGSCDDPTRIVSMKIADMTYFAVSCFDDNAIWLYRASDMAVVATRNDDGKGPRDLVWDNTHQTLWVTYFKSHFMGAYKLSDTTTSLDMNLVGRLGNADFALETTP
jgi:hypothetical protein